MDTPKKEEQNAPKQEHTVLFAVQNGTDIIYEVHNFSEWVLARPISPEFYHLITKMTMEEFDKEFTWYEGDSREIEEYLDCKNPIKLEIMN